MSVHYLDNSVANDVCPLRYMQEMLGGKWKMPILCMLAAGTPLRNATIKRRLGTITNAMLSQTLRELEASGLVHREQFNEVPPHVEYSLTDRGQTVIKALTGLAEWAINDMHQEEKKAACPKCTATC